MQAPFQQMPPQSSLAQPNQQALQAGLACPFCNVAADAVRGPRRCNACGKSFATYAGCVVDGSVVPPVPHPGLPTISVRWAEVFTYSFAKLEPFGVASGMNDPVTGMIPMDQSGVLFQDVVSITIWRKIRWAQLILALLVPAPLALGAVSLKSPGALIGAIPFGMLAAWAIYLAVVVGANRARVVGRYRVLELRFDSPFWRRQSFHDELLRRAGMPPSPLP